jgi:6-pyruvoyltetrahydropterin/6-carboxytetrahydropterin synthase
MRARIAKEFRFEASHVLPNHEGKCSRLHGHSYVVVVECEGPVRSADGSSSEGMVVDFSRLSAIWKTELHPRVDHHHLNDVMPTHWQPTTAENIAGWLLGELKARLPLVIAVTVWETATSSARVEEKGW